jgi:hypothetical protein
VFATNSYSQMEFSSAKFKAITPWIQVLKKVTPATVAPRYFSSNILKKPEGNFRVLLKLVILILFYDSNQ